MLNCHDAATFPDKYLRDGRHMSRVGMGRAREGDQLARWSVGHLDDQRTSWNNEYRQTSTKVTAFSEALSYSMVSFWVIDRRAGGGFIGLP